MNFTDAIKTCFSKYVTFSGRAARSEYWFFFLFWFLAYAVLSFIDGALFTSFNQATGQMEPRQLLSGLFAIVMILPCISVGVRRLHDTDKSGWWYLLCLIPFVGSIILLVWFCTKGTNGPNRFGADPLQAA